MNERLQNSVYLAQFQERLRQQGAIADLELEKNRKWFNLQMAMGRVAMVMLPAIAIVCVFAVVFNNVLPAAVVTSAAAAFFVDILGLMASVWKIVLKERVPSNLTPITPEILSVPSTPIAS